MPRAWDNARKWLALPGADRILLIEAAWRLIWLGLLVRVLPFRWIVSLLGLNPGENQPAAPLPGAESIGWAVQTAGWNLPRQSTCLVQALAAKAMLRRRGFPATLYLGVAKTPGEAILAHSWVRCGDEILTGAAGRERYTIIASYV